MKNKRVLAFIIDMVIISLLVSCLSGIEKINPNIDKYNNVVSKYNKNLDEAYKKYVDDQDAKAFFNTVSKYLYKLEKYSSSEKIIYIIVFILYFGLFQFTTHGETVGKRIFKLKVVNDDGSEVSLLKLCFRCLINGNTLYYGFNLILVIRIVCINLMNYNQYINYYMLLISLSYICDIIFFLFYLFRKDGRGINDVIFKTKVVERTN